MLAQIRTNEAHRKRVEDAREQQHQQLLQHSGNESFEKMMKIKEKNDNATKEKCDRTWSSMKNKEDNAKQELEKVRLAQERRKMIKAIRQEAHEIALFRAQKTEEYRKEKLLQQLKDKEERTMAIKRGFQTLDQMRNSMKDIMTRTRLGLRSEMNRLKHHDEFSPDRVVAKAIEVSSKTLFPSLERKFGILDPDAEDPVEKLFKTADNPDGFSFMMNNAGGESTDDNEALFEGDRTAKLKSTQEKNILKKSQSHGSVHPNDKGTLPIQALTQSKLKQALVESMVSIYLALNFFDFFDS